MFKIFREKLKSWIGKSKKEIEEKPEKEPLVTEKEIIARERTAPSPEEIEKQRKPSIIKKVREKLSYRISEEKFGDIFENLELLLLENNVALEVVENIKKQLKDRLIGKEIKKEELEREIRNSLKKTIRDILIEPDDIPALMKEKQPFVIIFFGINGAGKTTTIAKFANLLLKNNISCILAASDTFRAASIEQLQEHAKKLGIKMIKHGYEADPSAVAFDAIKHARAHGIKAVLIDTAGRMHTKENLLNEMKKICRVADPDLKIFIAESIAGNDAIHQAENFHKAVGIDGSILTKADVDEKGGTAISISYVTKRPILYLGIGQSYKDLEIFSPERFIEKLGL